MKLAHLIGFIIKEYVGAFSTFRLGNVSFQLHAPSRMNPKANYRRGNKGQSQRLYWECNSGCPSSSALVKG